MDERRPPSSIAILAHPLVAISLAGWLVNDWVLKGRYHNQLTGKLSDAFAMVVFPLLLAVLFERIAQRPMRWAIATTAVFFAGINLFEQADRLTARALNLFVPSELTMDPSDLVVLPLLIVPVLLWRRRHLDSSRSRVRLGRVLLVAGGLTCMATSAPEAPRTSAYNGTLVLTEDRPSVVMPLEYRLEGERTAPRLEVNLTATAFGVGDGSRVPSSRELVKWTVRGDDKVRITLADTDWAPVEVTWNINGVGTPGDDCFIDWPWCADSKSATLQLEAAPDEAGPNADAEVELPGDWEEWRVTEAVIRFPTDSPPRLLVTPQGNLNLATIEERLHDSRSELQPIHPPAGCGNPCELSIWASYRGDASLIEFFGDVELVDVTQHRLVETTDSIDVSTEPAEEGSNARHRVCVEGAVSLRTPVEEITTLIRLSNSHRNDMRYKEIVLSEWDECLARDNFSLWYDDGQERPPTESVFTSILTLKGNEPENLRVYLVPPN